MARAPTSPRCRASGCPVPAGFTITTEVCTYYYAQQADRYPAALQAQIEAGIRKIENVMGYKFGDATKFPLLVAVRSGARDSMPGMMDTILNLGLNDETVVALEKATQNPRFAWDCYRRFIQMYGDVVHRACRSAPVKTTSRSRRSSRTTSTRSTATTRSRTRVSRPTT